tara:strand:+ start:184 stop:333 length:150 start_codon:yes stop_codon:yes gene_type:complete
MGVGRLIALGIGAYYLPNTKNKVSISLPITRYYVKFYGIILTIILKVVL